MTSLFWTAIVLFVLVAGGLSLGWYRVNKRERLLNDPLARNRYLATRDALLRTNHLARSFELKAAKGTDRAPKLVPKADRRKPEVH